MNDYIFITDFDNTVTAKDFYWILLDDYIGQKGIDFYHQWKKDKKIGTEFLNTVFTWYTFTDKERIEALEKVEMDSFLEPVYDFVTKMGAEFYILSAGFRYYIDYTLKQKGLEHMTVLTNEGDFRNGSFIMEPDINSPWYSNVYGIDKGAVAKHYKSQCKTLIFVGDSEPDFHAAKYADIIFAKTELANILDQEGIKYYKYSNFKEILAILKTIMI